MWMAGIEQVMYDLDDCGIMWLAGSSRLLDSYVDFVNHVQVKSHVQGKEMQGHGIRKYGLLCLMYLILVIAKWMFNFKIHLMLFMEECSFRLWYNGVDEWQGARVYEWFDLCSLKFCRL